MALLTETELQELTGAKIKSRQKLALRRAGIRYVERLDGRPAVTWEAVNAVLCGQKAQEEAPKLDWIRRVK
ncbi:MAG: DUF4224 domain-containing protein [Hyphomicrobiaceae bacterium]